LESLAQLKNLSWNKKLEMHGALVIVRIRIDKERLWYPCVILDKKVKAARSSHAYFFCFYDLDLGNIKFWDASDKGNIREMNIPTMR